MTILDKSYQSINCIVKSIKNNLNWFHSFIYGDNKGVDRKLMWMNLVSMKTTVANNPQMICGDFNVVKSLAEK